MFFIMLFVVYLLTNQNSGSVFVKPASVNVLVVVLKVAFGRMIGCLCLFCSFHRQRRRGRRLRPSCRFNI